MTSSSHPGSPAGTVRRSPVVAGGAISPAALTEADIERLQVLLERVPAPLDALDASMLDGFLCGVLLQPQPVAAGDWLPYLTDVDGRALPRSFDAGELHTLALRRHAELDSAIAQRRWFDPWVFELEEADGKEAVEVSSSDAVYPWVAGFVTALELFSGLLRLDAAALSEPLALLYRHLHADDLEDADDLLELIDSFEPPAHLGEAVEELVRATLLLADVSRPQVAPPKLARRPAPRRRVRS